MTLGNLAKALGGDLNGKWINIPGPGHASKDRSLGVLFDQNAPDCFWLNSFADDDQTTCRAHVKALLQNKLSCNLPVIGETKSESVDSVAKARIDGALNIWAEAKAVVGTIVETYLASRGCQLTPSIVAADALRFHPFCPFGTDHVPAMVALMRAVATGEPRGVLITALQDDGSSTCGRRNRQHANCTQKAKQAVGNRPSCRL